jgi:transposase-like protein
MLRRNIGMGLFSKKKKTSGMGIMDGDALGNMLMEQSAKCLKCGAAITFEEGASLAMKQGYSNKVMCKKCKSVFSVQLTPRSMTLSH